MKKKKKKTLLGVDRFFFLFWANSDTEYQWWRRLLTDDCNWFTFSVKIKKILVAKCKKKKKSVTKDNTYVQFYGTWVFPLFPSTSTPPHLLGISSEELPGRFRLFIIDGLLLVTSPRVMWAGHRGHFTLKVHNFVFNLSIRRENLHWLISFCLNKLNKLLFRDRINKLTLKNKTIILFALFICGGPCHLSSFNVQGTLFSSENSSSYPSLYYYLINIVSKTMCPFNLFHKQSETNKKQKQTPIIRQKEILVLIISLYQLVKS